MLNVGLLGHGPVWETRYRPALANLRDRIRVRAVFDVVHNRAQHTAAQEGGTAVTSVAELVQRRDLRAVLVLDPGWYGHAPLWAAIEQGKPAYIAGTVGDSAAEIQALHQAAADRGVDLMPEFSRRYAPATARVRELMASRLGRVREIFVHATWPAPEQGVVLPGQVTETDFLVGLFDWCSYLTGTRPGPARTTRLNTPAHDLHDIWSLTIPYQPSVTDRVAAAAQIVLHPAPAGSAGAELRARIVCTHGEVEVLSPTRLRRRQGVEAEIEELASERPEVEVLLDHFSRRVVGGLIPVPTLEAVVRALELVHSVQSARDAGPAAV